MNSTEHPTLPGSPDPEPANIAPRFRPWHYMLVTQFIDTDDDGEDLEPEYEGEGYDDLDRAREAAAAGWCGHEAGVWDNWAGVWVVEPGWSDDVEMTAEGSAPYSVRPEAA